MLKWGNLNHSTSVDPLSVGAQGKIKWGESESLYCNFFDDKKIYITR